MRKTKRKIALSLFFVLAFFAPAQAENDSLLKPAQNIIQNKPTAVQSYFNLANIVDNILAQDKSNDKNTLDIKSKIRKQFIATSAKFNQGNAKVAYDEYSALIDKIDDDTSLLMMSRILYEIGFFSLGDKACEKIVYKNQFYDNIQDLETSFKPKNPLSIEDEILYAKLYSNIYFDNSALETIALLSKTKDKTQKFDFYNYTLSRAYLETKQYNNAINTINKAISLNPTNISYQMFKLDALIKAKKYKEAKNLIEKIEKNKLLLVFMPKLEQQKQVVLASLTNNPKERKYYIANKSYVEGNFEKTKKDCLNILNFDKDNDKIISLYAKSELALGNVERANVYFVNAYKIDKNNIDTLIGLGDIRFLHGDYKNAVKMYKKAYKKDKKNYEILIKLSCAQRNYAKNPKEIKKLEILLDKMPKNEYMAYYNSAISIAQKNAVLKEDYLKRSLTVNPMFESALGQLVELYLKNKNFQLAKGLIFNFSFTLEKNYYFYYLCGLYHQAENKSQNAIKYYKASLNLNPNFEIANTRLLKLIPNPLDEEI